MGMYTGIRLRGWLKPEFVKIVGFILERCFNFTHERENHWLRAAVEFPILAASSGYMEFAKKERSDRIPGMYGGISDWDDDDPEWEVDVKDGYFVLQSSLKNYSDELGSFVKHVVPMFFSSVDHCEVLYEEFDEGSLYALEDGEMVEKAPSIYSDDDYRDSFLAVPSVRPKPERWRSPWQMSQDANR